MGRSNSYQQLIRANEEIEDANARLLLLSEASKLFGRITSIRDILEAVSRVFIPSLGDWCIVFFRGWEKGQEFCVCHHGDPSLEQKLLVLCSLKWNSGTESGIGKLFTVLAPKAYSQIGSEGEASPSEIFGTNEFSNLKVIQELGMKSALCIPIKNRQEVVATALVVSAIDPNYFSKQDVALASEIGIRAGSSIEIAYLLDRTFESVKLREEFIALAAHELRTPLTSLLLKAQILERIVETGKISPPLLLRESKGIRDQTLHLILLVNRMLDVSRAEATLSVNNEEAIDMGDLVKEVLSTMSYELKNAGCTLNAKIESGITLHVDRTRIIQLLTNLLSNAAKFGVGKPIEVKVTRSKVGVKVSVQDQGIGISNEDQKRIFNRFFRAVTHEHFAGLGLGLYIAAQIAQAHGGALQVESEKGKGACFTLELPSKEIS